MTRAEALAVASLWHAWSASRKPNNRARREFVFKVVRARARLKHLDPFEVLDAVTNEPAWRALGASEAGVPTTGSGEAGDATEDRPGRETGATRVVEVEEPAH